MGGPTFSTMNGSFIDGSDGIEVGFSAALRVDKSMGKNWSFVTGIQWIQKGGKRLELPGSGGEQHTFVTQYLQFPLMLRKSFAISDGPWHIAPFTGLNLGMGLGCKSKKGDVFEFDDPCDDASFSGDIGSLELSVPIGTNLWIEFEGGSRFIFETRYELGISNVFNLASEAGLASKNKTMIIGVIGFSFPFNE